MTRIDPKTGKKVAIPEGTVLRTVSLRESSARMNNEVSDVSGLKYVLVEESKELQKDDGKGIILNIPNDERAQLFADAKMLGLSPAKNISTDKLKILVLENNQHQNTTYNEG